MNVHARKILGSGLLAVCLSLSTIAVQAATILGTSSGGSSPASIYSIDTVTGEATLIGSVGLVDSLGRPNKVSAVALHPVSGKYFGILGSNCSGAKLIEIDPVTGLGSPIGFLVGSGFDGSNDTGDGNTIFPPGTGGCFGGADSLVFSADGEHLYAGGWNGGFAGGSFLEVDQFTGAVLSAVGTDVHPNADPMFPSGVAYSGLARAANGDIWVSRGGNGAGLIHTVDPNTGSFSSTVILSDPTARISDIAFGEGDILFGSDAPNGTLVTISTNPGTVTVVGVSGFGGGAKISGLASVAAEVPADDCANPNGCDFGGQNLVLPPGVNTAGATVSRISTEDPTPNDDGVNTTVLADGRLFVAPFLRSASPIQILEMDSNLVISNGTILVTIEPGDFLDDPLPCDTPIPLGVDPQLQDIVVWQTTDVAEIREGRALEITSDCGGSSRGRSRGLSFFVVGLHIDCGIDWFVDPHGVKHCFIDLTHTKFHGLVQAVFASKDVLSDTDFRRLVGLTVWSKILFHWRFYGAAEATLTRLIDKVNALAFASSNFNHSGNIEMRAANVRFMIQKIQNIITNIHLAGDDDSDSD